MDILTSIAVACGLVYTDHLYTKDGVRTRRVLVHVGFPDGSVSFSSGK